MPPGEYLPCREPAGDKAVAEGKDGKGQKAATSGEDDGEPRGCVPPGRLRQETARAKAAEAERDAIKAEREADSATSQKAIDALTARVDNALAAMQRQPSQEPKPQETKTVTPPDFFEDPQRFFAHLTGQFTSKIDQLQQGFVQQRVEDSMATAHETHGQGIWPAVCRPHFRGH